MILNMLFYALDYAFIVCVVCEIDLKRDYTHDSLIRISICSVTYYTVLSWVVVS